MVRSVAEIDVQRQDISTVAGAKGVLQGLPKAKVHSMVKDSDIVPLSGDSLGDFPGGISTPVVNDDHFPGVTVAERVQVREESY